MDKTKFYLDLSKCRNGEQQTKAISLLPKQKHSNQYQITNRHTILSLDEKNNEWWVFGTRSLHKKELTYPEFIKLFEGGETIKSDNTKTLHNALEQIEKLESDKEEVLEALKYANRMLKNSKDAMYDENYIETIIQKHKQ